MLFVLIHFFKEIRVKKFLSLMAVVLTLGISTLAMDAEAAKRMGGGKSMGTQRNVGPDKAPGAAVAPPAAAAAAAAPAAAAKRSWMGPIAGLAAGLGLAALASHLGFGDELASMVMIGLLAFAIMAAIAFFMRKRAAAQQGGASRAGGVAYAGGSPDAGAASPSTSAYKVAMPAGGSMIGSALGGGSAATGTLPADFDAAGFERNAKVNFIRLQAANDAGDLDDIRQFTTPEMFAELKMALSERGAAEQKTDVLSIEAKVIDVEEDADRYVVSVRFAGVIRDDSGTPDESFNEIWHLTKSRQANSGWLLSGIQQADQPTH
jgi:predicted lipid-binding transport protein (Tim44 family)